MKRAIPILLTVLCLAAACWGGQWWHRNAAGPWSDSNCWYDKDGNLGSVNFLNGVIPGNGDDANLNGKVVVMDSNRIPAAGTLNSLTSLGTAGGLTVDFHALGNSSISATTFRAGTTVALILTAATLGSGKTLTITGGGTAGTGCPFIYNRTYHATSLVALVGSCTGGSGTTTYGIFNSDTGGISLTNGTSTGGTGARAHGIWNALAGVVTFNNCNLVNGTGGLAYVGIPPVWNMTSPNVNSWTMDANVGPVGSEVKQTAKFLIAADPNHVVSTVQIFPGRDGNYVAIADTNVRLGVKGGSVALGIDGNLVLPPVGTVLAATWFGTAGTELQGTFDEAARNNIPGVHFLLKGQIARIQDVALTGTRVDANVADVRSGVQYANPGNWSVGTMTVGGGGGIVYRRFRGMDLTGAGPAMAVAVAVVMALRWMRRRRES